jgi:two-component system, NarL family, nitrate/nitrite response regulator NarL
VSPEPATELLRVVVADDSDTYRSGIVRAIRAHPELELAGEFDDGGAALAAITELRPDVALLDIRMPGLDGLQVCERLRAADPPAPTRVLLLSAYMDDAVVARAREVGADGYLSKASSRREICSEAVRVGRGLE